MTKSLTTEVKAVAVKIGVVVGLAIFGAVAFLAGGTVRAATAIKGQILSKVDPHNLKSATKKMKNTEEAAKLTALQSVLAAKKGDKTKEAFLEELQVRRKI